MAGPWRRPPKVPKPTGWCFTPVQKELRVVLTEHRKGQTTNYLAVQQIEAIIRREARKDAEALMQREALAMTPGEDMPHA